MGSSVSFLARVGVRELGAVLASGGGDGRTTVIISVLTQTDLEVSSLPQATLEVAALSTGPIARLCVRRRAALPATPFVSSSADKREAPRNAEKAPARIRRVGPATPPVLYGGRPMLLGRRLDRLA